VSIDADRGSAGIYPWLDSHWSFFTRRLTSDRLAHALLIEGPAGTGKLTLARAMVEKLLCSGDQEHACGSCRSCKLLKGGAHPDYFELQPEEDSEVIKVDQVRGLISKLDLTTSISERKLAYIHPAENMNAAAANALLKSLEEPSGNAVLILVSNNAARLPITIRSRCQSISVNQPDTNFVLEWLINSSGHPAETVKAAVQAAGGSPLRAEQYLDSPEMDAYVQVRHALNGLLVSPASVSMIAAQLGELDPEDLWRWLSMYTVELIKSRMTGLGSNDLPTNSKLSDKNLLQLQRQADTNRQLSTTPVRGDLLLQDWLIKWAEQIL
jgi:DNA polymerase-3 subunit delta'